MGVGDLRQVERLADSPFRRDFDLNMNIWLASKVGFRIWNYNDFQLER